MRRAALLAVGTLAAFSALAQGATGAEPPPPQRPTESHGSDRPLAEVLTGTAKADYEAALLLYESGDYARASLKFQTAFAASGDVRLLWNQAACERATGHYARAVELVRQYLASHSPLVTPEAEGAARAFLTAALPLTARLVLSTQETGAEVLVDGQVLGTTPLASETRLDLGAHQVTLRKAGFVPRSVSLVVRDEADVSLSLPLVRVVHRGRLVVRAGKTDSIALDGHFAGIGSYDSALGSGPHTLRVSAAGARPFETNVAIEDDRVRAFDVTLKPLPLTNRVPTWVWLVGGSVLAVGAGTTAYLLLKPSSDDQHPGSGSDRTVQLPLR